MKLSSTTRIVNPACLFGAIAGDMIGSRHEWKACTDPQFALFSKSSKFTDDSQSVALAIYLTRTGSKKEETCQEIESHFGYDLRRSLDEIRPHYQWDSTCPGSVPESIIAFLESTDFESAVRNAILLGGDADTMAAISGSIAEAYYGRVPTEIEAEVRRRLPPELLEIVDRFAGLFLQNS